MDIKKNGEAARPTDDEDARRATGEGFRWRWALAVGLLVAVIAGAWIAWDYYHPTSQRMMLAVLPFENLSGDPAQKYFSDGFTDELITARPVAATKPAMIADCRLPIAD